MSFRLGNRSRALPLIEIYILCFLAPTDLSCLLLLHHFLLLLQRILHLFKLLEVGLGEQPHGGMPASIHSLGFILQKLTDLRATGVSMHPFVSRFISFLDVGFGVLLSAFRFRFLGGLFLGGGGVTRFLSESEHEVTILLCSIMRVNSI